MKFSLFLSIKFLRVTMRRPMIILLLIRALKRNVPTCADLLLILVEMDCSSAAVFSIVVSLVSDVLLCHFGASVERLPRYLQYLYQQAYDSAKATYEESNSKLNVGVQFKEEYAMKLPEISRADYNTILLHAEKISDAQSSNSAATLSF